MKTRLPLLTLFGLLVVGAALRYVFLLTHPPVDHHIFEYDTIAPIREQWWLFHFYGAGFGFILGFGALSVFTVLACRRRGIILATIGAVVATVGAMLSALGFAAEGVSWAYATDSRIVDAATGATLLAGFEKYPAMIDDPILTGFLLVPIGVLLQLIALWLARGVPRWLLYATLGVLLLGQVPLPIQAVTSTLELLALIALGAFALRGIMRQHRE